MWQLNFLLTCLIKARALGDNSILRRIAQLFCVLIERNFHPLTTLFHTYFTLSFLLKIDFNLDFFFYTFPPNFRCTCVTKSEDHFFSAITSTTIVDDDDGSVVDVELDASFDLLCCCDQKKSLSYFLTTPFSLFAEVWEVSSVRSLWLLLLLLLLMMMIFVSF